MMRAIGVAARLTEYRQDMWIFLLEAGVALGLLLFIVWWTWPRSDKKDKNEDDNKNDNNDDDRNSRDSG
jgi:hypothetical protein